ncbi:hypothetical protein YC2023_085525 [Brassica napus]
MSFSLSLKGNSRFSLEHMRKELWSGDLTRELSGNTTESQDTDAGKMDLRASGSTWRSKSKSEAKDSYE